MTTDREKVDIIITLLADGASHLDIDQMPETLIQLLKDVIDGPTDLMKLTLDLSLSRPAFLDDLLEALYKEYEAADDPNGVHEKQTREMIFKIEAYRKQTVKREC